MLAALSVEPQVTLSRLCRHHHPSILLTQTVNADPLPGRKVHHLALEREVVSLLGTAHYSLPFRAHHFDPEVVQLEGIVSLCGSQPSSVR